MRWSTLPYVHFSDSLVTQMSNPFLQFTHFQLSAVLCLSVLPDYISRLLTQYPEVEAWGDHLAFLAFPLVS